jgi:TP901 family phage tail tape measure protein
MNMLGAVTGATSNELIRMRDLAIQLGADLSLPATSAQDAANAMLVLSKANLSVSDTMAAAKGTLQLAAAAHIDEAQAAQITTDALLAFHLAGEKATQVADLLANASVHTKSNVTDLGAALRNSGAQFQAAKIPIEDLVTSIGLMAAAGIRGGQAGTDLKVMLQRLTAPTKEAAESMQRLGIHIFDAHGAILPLRDIIGQFTQKMSALTDASKLHEIQTIFGTRANRAAFDVLLQGIPAYDRMKDVVTKAGGAAELSEVQMRGLSGALEGLQSQVETVALAFGLPLQGGLESVVRLIAQMLPQVAAVIVEFARANPVISAFGVALVALTAVAGPLMIVLGGLIAFVGGPMIAAFAVAATAIAGLATAYAFNLGGLRDAVNGFGQAIAQVFQSLNGQVSGSGITILNILQAIVSTFASTTATLINLIAANVAVVTGHWGAAWEALKRIAAQGSSQTAAATANGLSGIPAAWQTILNRTLGLLNTANANYAGLGARAGASYAAGLVGQLQRSGLSGAMQEGILGASGTPKPLTGFERRPGDKPISIDPFANLPKIDLPKISGGGKVGKAAAIDVLDGFKEGLQGFESAISFLHDKVSTLDGLFDPMSKKARQNSKETVDALRSVASGVNEFLSAQGVAGKINSEEVAKMFSSGNTSLIEYATNWQKNSEIVRQAGIEMATQLHAPLKEVNDALKASGFDIQLSAEMWSKLSDVNKQNFIDISDVVAAQRLANEETKNSSGVISEATQAIVNHSAQQKNALLLYQQGILTGSEFIAMLTGLEPAIEKVGASAELTGQKVKSLLTLLKEKIDKDNIFAKLQEQNDIAQFTGNVIREFETMAQHLNFTTEQTTSYVLNNVRSVLGQMPPEVKAIAEQVLRNWADGFNRLPGVLDNVVNRALDSLGKFDIATRLKFKGTVSGVLDVLENLPGQFGSKLKRITDTVLSWINSIDKVFGGLHKVFDSVPDGLSGVIQSIIGLFKNDSSTNQVGAAVGGAMGCGA